MAIFAALVVAAVLLMFGGVPASTARAQGNVVATIDSETITDADLQLAEIEWRDRVAGLPPDVRRRVLLELLLDTQLMAKAATDEKLLSQAQQTSLERFSARLALQRLYLQKKIKERTSEAEVRALYEAQIKTLPAEEEVRASHILVDTLEQASDLARKISGGADFADLARRYSHDPTTNLFGGDLGYFVKSQMISEIEQAAFALQRGQISKPVKTKFGWHLVRVDDRRPGPVPTFDDVKVELTDLLVQRKTQEAMVALREKAKVKIDDPILAKTDAAPLQSTSPPAVVATVPVASDERPSKVVPKSELGFSVYENQDIIGGDLSVLKKIEPQVCAKSCQQNQACVAYSYDRWNRWCFLKSDARTLSFDPSSISGMRERLVQPSASDTAMRIDRRASRRLVGRFKNTAAATADACEGLCQGQSNCVGYTYAIKERACGLFENITSFVPNGDTVSGVKTQNR
jgi:peptidyl-prolyl cis-trans isomerase C